MSGIRASSPSIVFVETSRYIGTASNFARLSRLESSQGGLASNPASIISCLFPGPVRLGLLKQYPICASDQVVEGE